MIYIDATIDFHKNLLLAPKYDANITYDGLKNEWIILRYTISGILFREFILKNYIDY